VPFAPFYVRCGQRARQAAKLGKRANLACVQFVDFTKQHCCCGGEHDETRRPDYDSRKPGDRLVLHQRVIRGDDQNSNHKERRKHSVDYRLEKKRLDGGWKESQRQASKQVPLGCSLASWRSQSALVFCVECSECHLYRWPQSADSAVAILKRRKPKSRMDRQSRPTIRRRAAVVRHAVEFHSIACVAYFPKILRCPHPSHKHFGPSTNPAMQGWPYLF
jgi:hypothetical protein